jgi:hypothetical protein
MVPVENFALILWKDDFILLTSFLFQYFFVLAARNIFVVISFWTTECYDINFIFFLPHLFVVTRTCTSISGD